MRGEGRGGEGWLDVGHPQGVRARKVKTAGTRRREPLPPYPLPLQLHFEAKAAVIQRHLR